MHAGPTAARMIRIPDMRLRGASAALVLATLLASGCIRREFSTVEVTSGAMTTDLRAATNLPDRFAVVTPGAKPGDCPPQLRDAGLHTTLRLQRSLLYPAADTASAAHIAVGDYLVEPAGRYGEGDGEGLRVECGALRALGVVRL